MLWREVSLYMQEENKNYRIFKSEAEYSYALPDKKDTMSINWEISQSYAFRMFKIL